MPWLYRGEEVSSFGTSCYFGAIRDFTVLVRGELRFLGEWVHILDENFLDVTLHGYAAGPISMLDMIVPS